MSQSNPHCTASQADLERFLKTGQHQGGRGFYTQARARALLDMCRDRILRLEASRDPKAAARAALSARPPATSTTTIASKPTKAATRPTTVSAPAAAGNNEPNTREAMWARYNELKKSDPAAATRYFREHSERLGVRPAR